MRNSAHRLWPLAAPTVAPHPVATPSPPAVPPALDVGRGGYPPGLCVKTSNLPSACGVRRHVAALNWETCLPVPKRSHACALHMEPSPCPTRSPKSGSRDPISPIKAKTPAIVHDQASSRQPEKIFEDIKPATGLGPWSPATCRRFELGDMSPSSKAQSCLRTPHGPSPCPARSPKSGSRDPISPIKAKTPAIVPNQGSSRQTRILWDQHPASSPGPLPGSPRSNVDGHYHPHSETLSGKVSPHCFTRLPAAQYLYSRLIDSDTPSAFMAFKPLSDFRHRPRRRTHPATAPNP